MSAEFSPDLLALLDQLPAGGELFGVTPKEFVRGLRDGVETVNQARTGLLPVERELLRVHREELAAALLDECRVKLYGSDRARLMLVTEHTPRRDPARLQAAVAGAEGFAPEFVSEAGRESVLDWIERADAGRLAHQSMRLAPSNRGRLLQALDCRLVRGQEKTARAILRSMQAAGIQGPVLSMVCGQLADSYGLEGRPADGLAVLEFAVRAPVFSTGVNMLLLGLAAQTERFVTQGAELLNTHVDAASDRGEQLVASRSGAREAGLWPDNTAQTAMARRAIDRLDGVSRSLIDVMLSTH